MRQLLLIAFLVLSYAAACGIKSPMSAPEHTAQENVDEGTAAFNARDYKKAIVPYRKAYEQEKKERKLEQKDWYTMMDNLTIAYGITGDLDSAQEVVEYGISKEPTYAMFYYNLADCYGENDDEANAIRNLQLAYQYQDKLPEGLSLPEPTTDSSFRRLMKSNDFKRALEVMRHGKGGGPH